MVCRHADNNQTSVRKLHSLTFHAVALWLANVLFAFIFNIKITNKNKMQNKTQINCQTGNTSFLNINDTVRYVVIVYAALCLWMKNLEWGKRSIFCDFNANCVCVHTSKDVGYCFADFACIIFVEAVSVHEIEFGFHVGVAALLQSGTNYGWSTGW